jgi:UDP-N-acetylmuramoylalanine--D-glutamate ligase
VLEDNPAAGRDARATAPAGVTVVEAGAPDEPAALAGTADLVVPSPGVPVAHPVVAAALAGGKEVVSEVELAWRSLDASRLTGAEHLLVAITGTNGKTTVTKLVTAMLASSGKQAVAAGNVGLPLLDAVNELEPHTGTVLVTEVSSFQLEYTRGFRPDVSCWLNFAPDHLDWHPNLDHYSRAKAKIWAQQSDGCTAVINADDPVVRRAAGSVRPGVNVVTFGLAPEGPDSRRSSSADVSPTWTIGREYIKGPNGFVLWASELPRSFPHDLANTAAALAVATAAGATEEGCRNAAASTLAPPHRVQLVGQRGGVAWYDDSKATTPAAVRAGVSGFSSVVLIAGGRNKGLELSELARTVPPVRAVVAVGESAGEVTKAFAGLAVVRQAATMDEAVETASSLAVAGDAVVLSPGCASFDWYSSYAERGEVFSSLVREKLNIGAGAAREEEAV